jgi:hypothetical protein
LIVLALSLGHLTECGQAWVFGYSPDVAAPYPGYLLLAGSDGYGNDKGESAFHQSGA